MEQQRGLVLGVADNSDYQVTSVIPEAIIMELQFSQSSIIQRVDLPTSWYPLSGSRQCGSGLIGDSEYKQIGYAMIGIRNHRLQTRRRNSSMDKLRYEVDRHDSTRRFPAIGDVWIEVI